MYLDRKHRHLFAGDDVCSDVTGCGSGPSPGRPNGQFANLTTYRDRLARLVARLDEIDYVFPGHFMVNLENSVLVNLLAALNDIIANPEGYDYKVEQTSGDGQKRERMHKFVRGFGTIAYTKNGIRPPAV